jgi:Bacteriocin-protection, YdeI or OmpD-Associated/Domain of unknown function (DUF1905)
VGERLEFTTTLEPRGPAAAVVLSEEQVAAIGEGKKRFPVKVTINGHTWRGSVARMGGEYLIGLSRAVRGAAGVERDETVEVVIELDTEERTVDVPPALEELLAGDPAAKAGFDGLSYTHRKEYARWIAEAKQEATRERRLAQALERLREGKPPR